MPHVVFWDDQHAVNQRLEAGELMRRLALVLDGDLVARSFRDEPRYELRRAYPGDLELRIVAGHVYDTRETLSLAVELWGAERSRPLASYHLSGGLERVKASGATAWLRAANGVVLILGDGLGGLIEVQN